MNNPLRTNFNIDNVKNMINIINDNIKEFEENNIKDEFDMELKIMEIYPEFYQDYPFIVKKLCKKEDISMIYYMLDKLEKVENQEINFKETEKSLGNELAQKYLYPKIEK
jgi:hypothetical protein